MIKSNRARVAALALGAAVALTGFGPMAFAARGAEDETYDYSAEIESGGILSGNSILSGNFLNGLNVLGCNQTNEASADEESEQEADQSNDCRTGILNGFMSSAFDNLLQEGILNESDGVLNDFGGVLNEGGILTDVVEVTDVINDDGVLNGDEGVLNGLLGGRQGVLNGLLGGDDILQEVVDVL